MYVLSNNKKKYQLVSTENFQYLQPKKSLYIAWACFHNVIQIPIMHLLQQVLLINTNNFLTCKTAIMELLHSLAFK